MQKKEDKSHPLGICQRLFNFFMEGVIARGLKRVALGPVTETSKELPVDDRLTKNGMSRDVSDFEIQVHFKQTEDEELERWTHVDKSSINGDRFEVKQGENASLPREVKSKVSSLFQKPEPTGQSKAEREVVTTMARGGRPQRTVSIQETTEEDKDKRKGKNTVTPTEDSEHSGELHEEPKVKYAFPRHLISVASNINEKSDAFIKRKKEAMRRTLSIERKKI